LSNIWNIQKKLYKQKKEAEIINRPLLEGEIIKRPQLTIPKKAVGIGKVKLCHRCNKDLTNLPDFLVKKMTYAKPGSNDPKQRVDICQNCYQEVKELIFTYNKRQLKKQELNEEARRLSEGFADKKVKELIA